MYSSDELEEILSFRFETTVQTNKLGASDGGTYKIHEYIEVSLLLDIRISFKKWYNSITSTNVSSPNSIFGFTRSTSC